MPENMAMLRCLQPLPSPHILDSSSERGEMATLGQTSCLQAICDKQPACLLHIHIHTTVGEYATDTWQGPGLQQ